MIRLDRPVALAALRAALRSAPAIRGDLQPGAAAGEYRFTPWSPLGAATRYRVWFEGLVDADGVPFEAAAMEVSTAKAPSVVRFRPVNGTARVERAAILSVRFTQPMDRTATAAAFVRDVGRPSRGRARSAGPRAGPSSCSSRRSPSPTARAW